MSETNAPEPTMEEILASIRRIISEDDAPAPAAAEAAVSPGDPPSPPVAAPHDDVFAPAHDEVLELTERVEPEPPPAARASEPSPMAAPEPTRPAPSSFGDLDFAPAPTSTPASAPPPAPRPAAAPSAAAPSASSPSTSAPSRSDEPLVGDGAAGRAADHFGALASSLAMPAAGRSLEDVVRELLRPMMKDWLDAHLPSIVEARVQDEVERISRRRTY